MKAEPRTQQHEWLDQLVGDWTWEMPGKDNEPGHSGKETVRSLGGLWIVGEGSSAMEDGAPMTMLMTLGYDPVKGKFVGTFVASMMTHLWPYEGQLSADGKSLLLNSEGPSFTDNKKMAKYLDTITIENENQRTLTSTCQGEDGNWVEFMRSVYKRRS